MAVIDFAGQFATVYASIQADSVGLTSVYTKALDKLDEMYNDYGLTKAERGKLIAQVAAQIATSIANSAQQTAVEIVRQDNLLEKEIELLQAQIDIAGQELLIKQEELAIKGKELLLVQADIDLKTEQKESEAKNNELGGLIDKEIAVKVAQESLINAQKTTEDKKNGIGGLIEEQTALAVRQQNGFDDKVRQENTKSLGNVLSLSSAASGTIDAGLLATHKESINKAYAAIGDTPLA